MGIEHLLTLNAHLSVDGLIRTLHWCVRTKNDQPIPTDFDPYWHARQGVKLEFFAKHLDKIVSQLEMQEICPVTAI